MGERREENGDGAKDKERRRRAIITAIAAALYRSEHVGRTSLMIPFTLK